MRILALDISTRLGWAHDAEQPGAPISGTHRLPKIDGDDADGWSFGSVGASFWLFVRAKIETFQPELIMFEAPLIPRASGGRQNVYSSERNVRLLIGLAFLTETLVELSAGIEIEEVNVKTVKKFFAGNGYADKAAMMARCRQLGWRYVDDNAADAMAIWAHAKAVKEPAFAYRTTPMFARAP